MTEPETCSSEFHSEPEKSSAHGEQKSSPHESVSDEKSNSISIVILKKLLLFMEKKKMKKQKKIFFFKMKSPKNEIKRLPKSWSKNM